MPEGDGIKLNPVISGGVYLGNDTSRESFVDNFERNRDEAFVQSHSKKWLCHFFDSLRAQSSSTSTSIPSRKRLRLALPLGPRPWMQAISARTSWKGNRREAYRVNTSLP